MRLLGGALGDLGRHFPDTDARYRGISSLALLARVLELVAARGGRLVNVDATVLAQAPRLQALLPEMAKRLADTLGVPEPWWPVEDDIDAEVRADLDRWQSEGVRFVGEDGPRTFAATREEALAALEFYKHIWIVGGVDDVFNGRGPGAGVSTGRDYFFGAQLTFNDDDIRALLTIGGAALLGSAGR